MADSPSFIQASDNLVSVRKFATDTGTGKITELIQQTNITTASVAYYTNAGAPFTPAVTETVADYPIRIVTGEQLVSVNNVTVQTLSIIAFTAHAEIHVSDSAIIYTIDGTTPNAATDNGIRVNNGGNIELEGEDEVSNFQALSLTATPANLKVTFTNIPVPAE